MDALQRESTQRAQLWSAIQLASLQAALQRAGVAFPPLRQEMALDPAGEFSLNKPLQAAMSKYVRRVRPTLPAFVELVRGQTAADYRHNKELVPEVLRHRCRGFPQNHPSASRRIQGLRKNIRREQDCFRCLVLDADVAEGWPELFVSPFGAADKGEGDPRTSVMVIHDLSFPEDASVNAFTDTTDVLTPAYEHCSRVAQEMLAVKRANPDGDVEGMAGDVASAYRNACTHSECIYCFTGHIPEYNAIIIDMSAAFGWTGSAGIYSVLGGAVAFIPGNHTDAAHPTGFFNYHWVDNHINVTANVGTQCTDIEQSLRFAMTIVMGPAAVNDEKFTQWGTRLKVLGLVFDTSTGTVAIPGRKIAKAKNLVARAYHATWLSRGDFRSLLGSLRHVATCVRLAQAFLQRLRSGEKDLHRRARVAMTAPMRADLVWWWHILNGPSLNGVPLEYFSVLPEPDLTVTTDASDEGVCAIPPTLRRALTYQFTLVERRAIIEFKEGSPNSFDINYRELLACAFAVQAWAPLWRATVAKAGLLHIHFRIDNTSAVAWQSKMASRNPRAQVLIRLLSLWEHRFGLRFSASQIRGVDNTAADARSRCWSDSRLDTLFRELNHGWITEQTPRSVADLENVWYSISASTPLQTPPSDNTPARSTTGRKGPRSAG